MRKPSNQSLADDRPIVQRWLASTYFPQYPSWYNSRGHIAARERFLEKCRTMYRFEAVPVCPLCDSTQTKLISHQERHGFRSTVVICKGCSLLRTTPRLDRESMADHYRTDAQALKRGDSDAVSDQLYSLQAEKGRKILALLDNPETLRRRHYSREIASVAEVGCGEGGALDVLRERFSRVRGYELNPEAVAYGNKKGLSISATDFTDDPSRRTFDLVIYEQTLEHVFNLHSEIGKIAHCQEPGALLYIGVPGLLRVRENYDCNLLAYLEYQHLHHFTLATLEHLLANHGYSLVFGTEQIEAFFERRADRISPRLPLPTWQEIVA